MHACQLAASCLQSPWLHLSTGPNSVRKHVKTPGYHARTFGIKWTENIHSQGLTRTQSSFSVQHASRRPATESGGSSSTTSALQGPLPGPTTTAARLLGVLQAALRLCMVQLRFKHSQYPKSFHQYGRLDNAFHRDEYQAAVRQLVSDLGPLWLKLGQTLAVRPDLVGPDLAAALAGLQEAAPPFPGAVALGIVQEELGQPPQELFAWVAESPVASASLGQVHQAALKADGQLVAVKVQRPDVESQIALDLHVLTQLLRVLRWAAQINQDITAWARTLGQGLAQELDYVQEANNLAEFARAHSYLEFVDTPDVIWQLTTRRVLTTTWIEGQTTAQMLQQLCNPGIASSSSSTPGPLVQQHSLQQELLRLVDLGIQASLHQLLVTGVLHADPHPGNLVLMGSKLVYLDFGLLVRVPEETCLGMMAAIIHWSQRQWLALAEDMRQMGLLKPTTDLQSLADDLEQRFSLVHTAGTGGEPSHTAAAAVVESTAQPTLLQHASAIGFAEFAGVVATLAIKYRFELPAYYPLIIRSLTTLEGIALTVSPTARSSIARAAVKVVAGHLLCDQRAQAQYLLKELLLVTAANQTDEVSCSTHTLNLHLLEDLLELTLQDRGQLEDDASDTASSSAGHRDQWSGSSTHIPQQSTASRAVMMLSTQLGVPASLLAARLSSPDASRVRLLVAAHLAHRLSQRWRRLWRRSRQRVTSLVNAVVHGFTKCYSWMPHTPCKESIKAPRAPTARLHESPGTSLFNMVVWWTGTGVGGVKLSCQVMVLVAGLVMRQVAAGLRATMASYNSVRSSCNST